MRGFAILAACLLIGGACAAAEPAIWPQWRGPTRDCVTVGPAFPDKLSTFTQTWRTELSPSYSTPIVLADRVIVTETVDEKTERARALDRATGKELWSTRWPGGQDVHELARSLGVWIRATPASDGKSVYIGGMRDMLLCLNVADGKERWRIDFVKEYGAPLPAFGMTSSPLIDGDAVYTLAAAGIVRVEAKTGRIAWRVLTDDPKLEGGAAASLLLTTIGGRKMLVALNRKTLALVSPDSGEVLWKQATPAYRNTTTITPVLVGDNGLFITMFGGRSMRFDVAVAPDKVAAARTWDNSQVAYMSSPILVGDHIYAHLQSQRVACFDAKTGRERWKTDQGFGGYWSMVSRGERILALDQKGILYLFRATPDKFALLDQRKLGDAETWAHLAVCGDEVFVRDLKGLTAYRWPGK